MAQFATADDLAARLGVTFTSAEETRADTLLTLASGLIQRETRQTITQVTDDALTRPGSYDTRIRLPQRPVTSIASVTLNGESMTEGTDYYRDGDELVRIPGLASSTWNIAPIGGWGRPDLPLVITYTHGYATIPDAIKAIALEMVVRVWVNPGSVMQHGAGSEQTTFLQQGTPTGLLLTADERNVLRQLFASQNGSVTLR